MPEAIAADGTNVYWLDLGGMFSPRGPTSGWYVNGWVFQCPVTDCRAPIALASGISQGFFNTEPFGLAVDSSAVDWLSSWAG